jgi:hypothetical protein
VEAEQAAQARLEEAILLEMCYTHEHEDSLLLQWEEETGEHLVLIRSRREHEELLKVSGAI